MLGQWGLDHRRRALVTVVASASLLGGSWLLISAATASPPSHRVGTTTTPTAPRAAGRVPDPAPTTSALTVPAPTIPLLTIPEATTPAPTSPAPLSSTAPTTVPVPVTSPAPTTPPPAAVAAPASPPEPRTVPPIAPAPTPPAPVSAVPAPVAEPAGSAPVASALIVAVNLQSGGKQSIPVTPTNVILLQRWMANEGGLWADNPLNTSLGAGSLPHQFTTGGQDSGIPIFSSMSSGVAANATTLLGDPRYAHILRVLSKGTASCTTFATAVIRSPWASGHYGHSASGFCTGHITPRHRTGQKHHAAAVSRPARRHHG